MVGVIWFIEGWKWSNLRGFGGVNGKFANFTPIVTSGTYVSMCKLDQNVLLTCL